MNDPSKTIKTINSEYADLIESEITGRKLQETIKSYDDIKRKSLEKSRLTLPAKYGFDSSFQRQVAGMQHELREFWKDKNDEYSDALSQLDSLKLYTAGGMVESLALYFDTVIFSHGTTSNIYPIGDPVRSSILVLESLRPVYDFLPLFKADTDLPIVAVNPNLHAREEMTQRIVQTKYGPALEIGGPRAMKNSVEALKKIAKIDLEVESYVELTKHIRDDGLIDISSLFDITDLAHLFRDRIDLLSKEINEQTREEMIQVVNGEKQIVSGQTFMHLMILVFAIFESFSEIDQQTEVLNANPHIHQADLYKMKMEIESGYSKEYLNFDDKMFAAHSLNFPPLITLGDLSAEEIVRFRESGGMEDIRSAFNEKCNQIKYAPLDDFERIGSNVVDELKERVINHNSEIKSKEVEIRNTIKNDVIMVGLELMISFLTINIPPVAESTFLSASSLAGFGKILIDQGTKTYDDFVTGKEDVEQLKDRPIGIIAKNIEKMTSVRLK